jgi:hypothetical protein
LVNNTENTKRLKKINIQKAFEQWQRQQRPLHNILVLGAELGPEPGADGMRHPMKW